MSETIPQNAPNDKASQQQIVMVVDSRPLRQFYTSIFLQRLKYQVIMAKTAEDALLFLRLTVPLIVIANYDLSPITGLELLKRVKHDPRTRSVPFIVYTSNRSPEVQQVCKEAGCSAFLHHPCNLDGLYAAVQKATQAKPRSFVRLTAALDVVVGDERPADYARNDIITAISEKGMFVSTAVPLALGKVLFFTFHLPNAPGWVIRVEGQVLFSHFGSNKAQIPGMAVKFLKIGDQEQLLVREFIKQELMAGIAPDKTQAGSAVLRGMMGYGSDTRAGMPILPA
jgi:CheY-like chemotaxis protein/Tfp pilus assembly protein PilZ